MNRKSRFLWGLLLVMFIYSLPMMGFTAAGLYFYLLVATGAFVFSVYMVYRVTIRNVKLKYPIVSPDGHPDAYTGRMPRPICEDMERYPWFFKKRNKKLDNKKVKKR
ncbi:MAG: hypothetical protein ABSG57_10185 [Candidatus Bathyarchaeia archaeon]